MNEVENAVLTNLWMLTRYAAVVLKRGMVRSDGKTAQERKMGRKSP